jgi:tRNA (guanine37-N1)-methyltransferase
MRHDVRSELTGVIPDALIGLVPRSFDVIGSKGRSVAIVEVPEGLSGYEVELAKAIMRVHRNVVSVLSKGSERTGEFRTREMRIIYGDPDTVVLHRESGCVFKVDPVKAYFSPRESTERDRVSGQVGDGEKVLVMFSGVGPFPIRIAKRSPGATMTAVELNPYAHNLCVENISLNRVEGRVRAILGDVREVCPRLGERFDRVLMPLPKGAYQFLDVAVASLGRGGILHFYHWAPESSPFAEAERLVTGAAASQGRTTHILDEVKVSQYSPRVWKVCLDVAVG